MGNQPPPKMTSIPIVPVVPVVRVPEPKPSTRSFVQPPYQAPFYPQPIPAQKAQHASLNRTQSLMVSQPVLPLQNLIRSLTPPRTAQRSTVNLSPPPIQVSKELQNSKQLKIGSHQSILPQVPSQNELEIPEIKLSVNPEIPARGSILQKTGNKRNQKPLKIQTLTQQIDQLRKCLRECLAKMTNVMVPAFLQDIKAMNSAIDLERQGRMKDKDRVLFLLKQRKHYYKLCTKFQEYQQRIKSIILSLRKNDSLQSIAQSELVDIQQSKVAIETILKNVQNDLPQKSWKILIEQPVNNNYLSVVQSAIRDPEIVDKYKELEAAMTNPQILQRLTNEQMTHSVTRRVGENQKQPSKKLVQGPADYVRQNQIMRDTRQASKV